MYYNLIIAKNPFVNSVAALVYIVFVATIMNHGSRMFGGADTAIMPIAALSLFVLSVTFMGYTFLFQPLQLYLDGKKKEGANLFLRTIGVFAVITVGVFVVMLLSAKY